MAVIEPLYQNQVEYTGEAERRGVSSPMALNSPRVVRSGVIGTVAPAISISSGTVTVGEFRGVVGSAKGGYYTGLDGATSAGTLTTSDPTNPRLDRVILEVIDPDNTKPGSRGGVLRIVDGTPGALPSLPALPSLALHLGTIRVPASGTGSPTAIRDARFTVPAGVPIPVRNIAERNEITPVEGLEAYRLDTQTNDFVFDGGWGESFIPLPDSEGWIFSGGLKKSLEGGLVKFELTARFTRTISPFTIPASGSVFMEVISNWMPANGRPGRPVSTYVAVLNATDQYFGQAILRVGADGTIAMCSTGSSITFAVGGYIQIMATWVR